MNPQELQELLLTEDDALSDQQIAELQQELLHSSESRKTYLRFNQMDDLIRSVDSLNPALQKKKNNIWLPILSATAAAVITLFITTFSSQNKPLETLQSNTTPEPTPIAYLETELNAQFKGSANSINEFNQGEFHLEAGIASLNFANGAEVVIEENSTFELINTENIRLNQGKMWVYCPSSAVGFTVHTPNDKSIVDLGTSFGVEVFSPDDTIVQVFSGSVQLESNDQVLSTLEEGDAVTWQTASKPSPIDFERAHFTTKEVLQERRLRTFQSQLLSSDSLIYYSDFNAISPEHCINTVSEDTALSKSENIVYSSGRFPNDYALNFTNPTSTASLNLPDASELKEVTVISWIKAENLSKPLSAILNSPHWQHDSAHFQVSRSGEIALGLFDKIAHRSPIHSIPLNEWKMVTFTANLKNQKFSIYIDEEKLPIFQLRSKALNPYINLKDANIGGWRPHNNTVHDEQRNFNGAIDEMIIFDRALTEKEISLLYKLSKP